MQPNPFVLFGNCDLKCLLLLSKTFFKLRGISGQLTDAQATGLLCAGKRLGLCFFSFSLLNCTEK